MTHRPQWDFANCFSLLVVFLGWQRVCIVTKFSMAADEAVYSRAMKFCCFFHHGRGQILELGWIAEFDTGVWENWRPPTGLVLLLVLVVETDFKFAWTFFNPLRRAGVYCIPLDGLSHNGGYLATPGDKLVVSDSLWDMLCCFSVFLWNRRWMGLGAWVVSLCLGQQSDCNNFLF